ncbi:MAG: glutamyl-tRNA reductase, partial [Alphaproteobacteria bacterium]|nr:glutamyl-tRNA reductase [Alphaproteobacteria bacterium]
ALVEAELAAFGRHEAEREAVPALTALRGVFETARQTVLDDLPEGEERAAIDRATRLLVNRLLHRPSAGLRRLAAEGRDQAAAEALLRRLFLDAGDEEPKDEE